MNYEDEARRSIEREEVFRRWIQSRVETLHTRVSAYDVLRRYNVDLRYDGAKAEQMFCPFHGNSRTPAARYHPKDLRSPDHVWCFVCNERWDAIALFRKFENLGTDAKFSAVLRGLERAYGIIPPETPPAQQDEPDDHERLELEELFLICDRRLRAVRKAFDMKGYLTVGSILDRLSWQYANGKIVGTAVRTTLTRVLTKIGEKARACPAD